MRGAWLWWTQDVSLRQHVNSRMTDELFTYIFDTFQWKKAMFYLGAMREVKQIGHDFL